MEAPQELVPADATLTLLRVERLPEIDTFDRLPVVIAHGGLVRAVGKGLSLEQRAASALGEWAERTTLYAAVPERYACQRQIGADCLPPPYFGLDAPGETPDLVLPYTPYGEVGWIRVRSPEGERRWLHQPGWAEAGFYRPTSNGAAVGRTTDDAMASATAELLERHAFVAWWYRLARSQRITVSAPPWHRLEGWLSHCGWELSAHLMPALTAFPVVLAAAFRRTRTGMLRSGIVGLGTSTSAENLVDNAAVSAALEIVQALETFFVLRAHGRPITGDLTSFLTPHGAGRIAERLHQEDGQACHAPQRWVRCPLDAARNAGIQIWAHERPTRLPGASDPRFVQVFSPNTLPFPSTGRGRRLNHPVLREKLLSAGRTTSSLPPMPHPLG